jgi:p21-activated kinase 1
MQNMPKQWSTLLDFSNISKEDQSRDPQAVIDVLEFYSNKSSTDTRARYLFGAYMNSLTLIVKRNFFHSIQ